MSDDDDEADKTQIFLPGAARPAPPAPPTGGDDTGVLLKPQASQAPPRTDKTAVDFDITSGAGLGEPAAQTPKPAAASAVSAGTVAAAAARKKAAAKPTPPTSSGSWVYLVIAVVAAVAAYLLLR